MDLKNKSTTELKVLRDKVYFELNQRTSEVEVPVIQMIGNSDEIEFFDLGSIEQNKDYINRAFLNAISGKNRILNIKLVMIPESDYKELKATARI